MTGVNHTSADTTGPLLPCPFCGSKPVRFWTSDYQQLAQVRCENDDCFGPSTPVASVRDADRMWNRRISVPAQATLWPDIKQLHDAIAECIGREGLTYSGIRRAAKRVQELYAATIAAQPPAAPVETAIMEATEAQHTIPRQEGRPAQFTRNGKLEVCQCSDCRRLQPSSAGSVAAWTVRLSPEQDDPEYDPGSTFDVLLPDGTWESVIAFGEEDARDTVRDEWNAKHPATQPQRVFKPSDVEPRTAAGSLD
jgi:hypothetical protein